MIEKIRAILINLGWENFGCNAIVTKNFDTAVGVKEAIVFCHSSPRHFVLLGSYQSEGRNVLESCAKLIPLDFDDEQVLKIVTKFSSECIQMVDESYARRLKWSRSEDVAA